MASENPLSSKYSVVLMVGGLMEKVGRIWIKDEHNIKGCKYELGVDVVEKLDFLEEEGFVDLFDHGSIKDGFNWKTFTDVEDGWLAGDMIVSVSELKGIINKLEKEVRGD